MILYRFFSKINPKAILSLACILGVFLFFGLSTFEATANSLPIYHLVDHPAHDDAPVWVQDPVWSPNREWVAFQSDRDGYYDIWIGELSDDRSTLINLVNLTKSSSNDFIPSWSPDGSKIVFDSFRGGDRALWIVDVREFMNTGYSEPARLTTPPSGNEDFHSEWSPNGRMIAFTRWENGNSNIYVVYLVDESECPLTFDSAVDEAPTWSPDSKRIAFRSDRGGHAQLYLIDVPEPCSIPPLPTPLIPDLTPFLYYEPDWSPDGSEIAFRNGQSDIYLIDITTLEETQITSDSAKDGNPTWSPDGRTIAFWSQRAGSGDIFSITVKTTKEIPIDIKPGSCRNPLNIKSKGVLPVAVLGSEDLDVTEIDLASIRLNDVAPIRSSIEDVRSPNDCYDSTPDGFDDLKLKFDIQEIVSSLGPVEDGEEIILVLTGTLSDGTEIEGEDVIVILKKGKKSADDPDGPGDGGGEV